MPTRKLNLTPATEDIPENQRFVTLMQPVDEDGNVIGAGSGITQGQTTTAIENATNLGTPGQVASLTGSIIQLLRYIAENPGGGGSGASQAEVQAAIEAATNLDGLEGSLTSILAAIDGLEGNTTGLASQTTLAAILAALILPSSLGQKTSANSFPVVLPSDQTVSINTTGLATQTTLASILSAVDGLETNTTGLATQATLASILSAVDGLETNTTGLATQTTLAAILAALSLPTSLGQKTSANSLAVVLPSDQTVNVNTTGLATDTNIDNLETAVLGRIGEVQETPTANTLLDRVKSVADALATTLTVDTGLTDIATQTTLASVLSALILPASLGQKTSANSLAVVLPSDQTVNVNTTGLATDTNIDNLETAVLGRIGEVQETPTANTLLSRVKALSDALSGTISVNTGLTGLATQTTLASVLSALILPDSLGQKTSANSFAAVLASDQSALNVIGNTSRAAAADYRNSISSPITSLDVRAAGLSLSNGAADGSSPLAAVQYSVTVVARTPYGLTAPVTATHTTTGSNYLRATTSQVTGATHYSIYVSASSSGDSGKFLITITEAQRATGGVVDSQATLTAGGAASAIDIGVVGTGTAINTSLVNTAYVIPGSGAVDTSGHNRIFWNIEFTPSPVAATDMQAMSARFVPMLETSPGVWRQADPYQATFATESINITIWTEVDNVLQAHLLITDVKPVGMAFSLSVRYSLANT